MKSAACSLPESSNDSRAALLPLKLLPPALPVLPRHPYFYVHATHLCCLPVARKYLLLCCLASTTPTHTPFRAPAHPLYTLFVHCVFRQPPRRSSSVVAILFARSPVLVLFAFVYTCLLLSARARVWLDGWWTRWPEAPFFSPCVKSSRCGG